MISIPFDQIFQFTKHRPFPLFDNRLLRNSERANDPVYKNNSYTQFAAGNRHSFWG